jgi:UDP-N-acetylglucosamine 2-epimerase
MRPEAIKMAPVLKALEAPHRQMLDQVLDLLDIVPDQHMAQAVNPYGDGRTAEYVVEALLQVGTPAPD